MKNIFYHQLCIGGSSYIRVPHLGEERVCELKCKHLNLSAAPLKEKLLKDETRDTHFQ